MAKGMLNRIRRIGRRGPSFGGAGLTLAILALFSAVPVAAVTVPVNNPSFESPAYVDGDGGGVDSWVVAPSVGYAGAYNFNVADLPVVPDLDQVGFAGIGGSLTQTLAVPLTAYTLYTLQVDVGRQLVNSNAETDHTVRLLAGSTVIAEGSAVAPAPGTFNTVTVTFQTGASHVELGSALGVQLFSPVPVGSQVLFDNVRLDATVEVLIDLDAQVASSATPSGPVTVHLGPGTYTVTPVGTAGGGLFDAWSAWSANLNCDGNGENCERGFENEFELQSASLPYRQIWDGLRYATALQALSNAQVSVFTLAVAEDVHFGLNECSGCLGDNRGGNSLRIIQVEPVTASAPDTTVAYNQVVSIPVRVGDVTGKGLVAGEVNLLFDGDLLAVSSVTTGGALMAGWTVQSNVLPGAGPALDTLKVAAANTTPLSGSGALFEVVFQAANVRLPSSSTLTVGHLLFNDGSVVTTANNGSVTFTGTTATTGSTPTVLPREPITVQIHDADEDTNPATVQQVSVAVVNGSQTEGLTLVETGPNTGIFEGVINTVFSITSQEAGNSGDGTVQAQRGDVITFLFDDQLNAAGLGPIQLHQETTVIGGTDGAVDITDATQPGDVIYVRVVDADLNIAFGVAETAGVIITSSNGDQESVTVTELDVDDAAFFGSIASDGGAVVIGDGVINGAKGNVLTVTYDDVVTFVGDQLDRTSTDQMVDPFGDADGNTQVQAFDAAQVLLHVLAPHITGLELIQSNVDLDPVGTGITPYDASLILQKRVGLIGIFPVQTAPSTNHPQPTPLSPKRVTESRWLALEVADGYVSVVADARDGILSGNLLLTGAQGRVEVGPELGNFLVASRDVEGGLRIVFAGAAGVAGQGELLRIHGTLDGARIAEAELNDGNLVALTGGVAATEVLPATTSLLGNHPNPFNPETQIRFDLGAAAPVQLTVYDVLGQTVRILVAQTLPAGHHTAMWDGRNAAGLPVSSGTYFYRLVAGDVVQMQRMMLVK